MKIRDTKTEREKIAHIVVADFVLFTTLGITLSVSRSPDVSAV